ncbi:hypothetical protein DC522_21045 [Microvirga sp. KLBC 81]|uniref:hypothetical protein n=1 Tax=Microvirga sp. KLBC 81 TaxID=1862707 RepID=UPI000D50DDC5|nr:hypothetical protein [Microvirga sp. KLBC 81]PVE22483.1 hypothetical protein DC522_21045 [Microvirga sp. KLBC 81]
MMSSLANVILFIALVTTSAMVAVMYRKLKRLDQYHAEYKRIFDKTGEVLMGAQNAVTNFGSEGRVTLVLLGSRIEEARTAAQRLEELTRSAHELMQSRPPNPNQ